MEKRMPCQMKSLPTVKQMLRTETVNPNIVLVLAP